MRAQGLEPQHGLRSQPGGQPVDQAAQILAIGPVAVQTALGGGQPLGLQHREPHLVETETGIQRTGQGRQPFAEQA